MMISLSAAGFATAANSVNYNQKTHLTYFQPATCHFPNRSLQQAPSYSHHRKTGVTTAVMRSKRGRAADGRIFREAYGPWVCVTGASSGIGKEFARQLAWHGCNVIVVARRQERLESLCAVLKREYGVSTLVVCADLSTANGRETLLDATSNLDVGLLVNNAGVTYMGYFENASDHQVQSLMDVNVGAVTHLAHAFGRRFKAKGRGGILFLSSMSSKGCPYLSVYAASKAYVTCLSYSIATELSPYVQCMALEPGFVFSEMTEEETPNTQFPGIITAEQCVDEALSVFGIKDRFTPGFFNRLFNNLVTVAPRSLVMAFLKYNINVENFERSTVCDPEALKDENPEEQQQSRNQ